MNKEEKETSASPVSENAQNLLGIDTTSIGKLKPRDLTNNPKLAATILTYLTNCEKKVSELETENETLKTYPANYEQSRLKSRIAQGLGFLATIAVGFGINFLTSNPGNFPGIVILIFGVVLETYALYLTFK